MPTPSKQGAGAGGHAQDGPHGGGSKRGVMQAIVVQALRGQQNGDSKQPASLVQALEKIGHMCNLMGLPEDVKKSAQRMCEVRTRANISFWWFLVEPKFSVIRASTQNNISF